MARRHENRAKNGGYNYAPELYTESFLDPYEIGSMISLVVRPQVEIFRKEDSGWSIYIVETDDRRFKISGTFPVSLSLGSYYEVEGTVSEYKFERQLTVQKYKVADVYDEESILNLLRNIEALNTKAYYVYKRYGPKIIKDIQDHPEKVAKKLNQPLIEVNRWRADLMKKSEIEEAFAILKGYGIKDSDAKKLLDKFGVIILQKIEENPYFLINGADGFSFSKCDEIALQNGYPYDGIERIMNGATHILREIAYQGGHCYLPSDVFMEKLYALLNFKVTYRQAYKLYTESPEDESTIHYDNGIVSGSMDKQQLKAAMIDWQSGPKKEPFCFFFCKIPEEAIQKGIHHLLSTNQVVSKKLEDGQTIFMLGYYAIAEDRVANAILLLKQSEYCDLTENEKALADVCKKEHIQLEEKQKEAATMFTRSMGGIFILNGAAGCGKTFVLNTILKTLKKLYKKRHMDFKAKILAPTGKATQVAHQATGLPGFTIHRELGYVKGGSTEDKGEVIKDNVLVIDEFSMVDISLAADLFGHIGLNTKVIILGDTEQLPSIGPGSVLKDLIESGVIPMVTLNVVKRQAQGSAILENANNILAGNSIQHMVQGAPGDAHVIERENALDTRMTILRLAKKAVPKFGLMNVQVLCPQKKTQVGIEVMNYCLQQVLNPPKENETMIPARKIKLTTEKEDEAERTLYYKKGDKVIHTKNNYNMEWYKETKEAGLVLNGQKKGIINGEMGEIISVEVVNGKKKTKRIQVRYDDGIVVYENDFSELEHAYAITIHKAQGSQWQVVIAPVCRCNRIMLSRKILYTLYTRAQDLNFVVGEREAMDYAVKNNRNAFRYTDLIRTIKGKAGIT